MRPGEAGTALLLTLNVFLLLATYYFIKPLREALILSGEGAEVKSYAAAGQAILLLGLVPAYGLLADRLPRRGLLNAVTAFFVALPGCFLWRSPRPSVPVGVVFFLWVGIFNLMIVAQFWSFANDLYTKEQGERLFVIVAFGMSLGAVLGSILASEIIPLVGVPQAAAGCGRAPRRWRPSISNLVDARERARHETHLPLHLTTAEIPAATGEYQIQTMEDVQKLTVSLPGVGPVSRRGTFRLVFGSRYLLLIALLMLIVNWVNTTGEYILGRTVPARQRRPWRRDGRRARRSPSTSAGSIPISFSRSTCWAPAPAVCRLPDPEVLRREGRRSRAAAASRSPATPSWPSRRFWRWSARSRSRRTPPTTRSRIRCATCSFSPPAGMRSTRPSRPSTRSSGARATCCPRRWSSWVSPCSGWERRVLPG